MPSRFGLFRVRSPLLAEFSLFLWVLRCFSSPGSLPRVYGFNPGMTPETCVPATGFPIRRSPDRSLHTAPRSLSQCSTSFIGTWRQGIHRTPLVAYARDAEKLTIFRNAIQLLRCALAPSLLEAGGLAAQGWSAPSGAALHLWKVKPGLLRFAARHFAGPHAARTNVLLPAIPFRLRYRSPILAPAMLRSGGDEGTRTPDICFAKAALSQLSYIPEDQPSASSRQLSAVPGSRPSPPGKLTADRCSPVGLSGFEPETFPLSEERSNQLS